MKESEGERQQRKECKRESRVPGEMFGKPSEKKMEVRAELACGTILSSVQVEELLFPQKKPKESFSLGDTALIWTDETLAWAVDTIP